METLLAEQANLEKRGNLGKTINDVQNIVDLLVNARNSIASGIVCGMQFLVAVADGIR